MVKNTNKVIDPAILLKAINALCGKIIRAELVSFLYE